MSRLISSCLFGSLAIFDSALPREQMALRHSASHLMVIETPFHSHADRIITTLEHYTAAGDTSSLECRVEQVLT
jgi:hypothetical protein